MIVDGYAEWEAGEIPARAALASIANQLKIISAHKEELEAREKVLRSQAEQILAYTNETAIVVGGLEFRLTPASNTTSYTAREIDAYALWLVEEGHALLAERLLALKRESSRAGGLRISKERT